MAQWKTLGCSAVMAALLCSTAARADVTAADVWQNWKDYYQGLGYTISAASEDDADGVLTLTGVTASTTLPDGKATISIAEVVLEETDGAVDITLSPEVPMVIESTTGGETTVMNLLLKQTDLILSVSGSPEEMTYDIEAPEVGFGISQMTVNGAPVDMVFDVVAKDITGQSIMASDGDKSYSQTLDAAALDFTMKVKDPKGTGTFDMTGSVADVSGSGDMLMPEGLADIADMNAALKAGLEMSGSFSYGEGNYSMNFADGADTMAATGKATGGSFDMAMQQDSLSYGVTGTGAELALTSAQIPFPVNVSLAESAFQLLMPIAKGEAAAPFELTTRLVDLKVNDEIWAMFDPQGKLPRNPATLIVDLSGKAKLLADLMDPAVATSATPPGELEALELKELKLAFAGAELTGGGAFTFDNTDTTTFPGMPKPLGSLNLRLLGGNTLLDTLVGMGLLPEDQASGFRMMAGLFANAGPGADELNSTIEVKEDGGLYANGQRLQ